MVEMRFADVRGRRSDGSTTLIGATFGNAQIVAPITADQVAGGETLTVAAAAIPLAAEPGNADSATIECATAAVRYKLTEAPTATVGHVLEPNDILELESAGEIAAIRFIRRDGVSATLEVTYGRRL